jgi:hypothetical protein
LPIIYPTWEQLYYVMLLGLFALIGWGQVRVGRVGVSRPELALLFCDPALLTFIAVVPNPFSSAHWPAATFGTPFVGRADASNALRCAQAMGGGAAMESGKPALQRDMW